jgi:O-antigen ligase
MESTQAPAVSSRFLMPDSHPAGEVRFAFGIAIAVTLLFVGSLMYGGGSTMMLAFIPVLALLLFLETNFFLCIATITAGLFLNLHHWVSVTVWFSIPYALAFLIHRKALGVERLTIPLKKAILFWGICIIPSFMYNLRPVVSVALLLNVAAYLVVSVSVSSVVRSHKQILGIITVYLVMVMINSLDVIFQGLMTGNRVFGFAGIMFVDYSGLGICICVAMGLLSKGHVRLALFALAGVFVVALTLTQTRNAWLSTVLTLFVFLFYLSLAPGLVGMSRRQLLVMAFAGVFAVVVGSVAVVGLNPKIEKRAMEVSDSEDTELSEQSDVMNSFQSRMLIWDTALNAFKTHPITGVGVYAFPYVSQHYATIPKVYFLSVVIGRTAHQSLLASLVETGIIGTMGFLYFFISLVRYMLRTVREASTVIGKKTALVGSIAVFYAMISLLFTDAWLYGHGIILLALIVGLMTANHKVSAGVAK